MYAMASGRPPFRAESSIAVLMRVVKDTPRPIREILSDVPEWLCGVIEKLHAKNPDDRYANAEELVAALDTAQANVFPKRQRWPAALIGLGLGVLLALTIMISWPVSGPVDVRSERSESQAAFTPQTMAIISAAPATNAKPLAPATVPTPKTVVPSAASFPKVPEKVTFVTPDYSDIASGP